MDRIDGIDSVVKNDNIICSDFQGTQQLDVMQKVFFLQSEKITTSMFRFLPQLTFPDMTDWTERRGGELRRCCAWYYGPQQRLFASYKLNIFGEPSGFYDKMSLTYGLSAIGRKSPYPRV